MMSYMQNFGLIREGAGNAILKPIPIPKLRDDYILVRTVTIALNPTDWTTLDAVGDDGTIVGCDHAGIVEEVGKDVKKPSKKGDRIAGCGHGGNDANPENGAFARYIAVKGDIQFHIPDDVSFEEACTVGVGFGTTGLGLYKFLGLPLPPYDAAASRDARETIFIYGGSTATGSVAIQFAKLSGLKVVTTSSPKNFELVKSRGADLVYDYHIPNVGQQIREATGGRITKVFDTVSTEPTARICADVIGPKGGVYCNLLGDLCPRSDVESIFFLGYSASGESYKFEGETYAAQPEDFAFASMFASVAECLWADGKLKVHPQRIGEGGLLGAVRGMEEMRQGRYSGEKLVYRVDDTKFI